MIVYVDFDGTIVEHEYPKIGRCNFGCFEVMKKLQDNGHTVILNTYRADANDGTLEKAVELVNERSWMLLKTGRDDSFKLLPILSTASKIQPHGWDLKRAVEIGELHIDDNAYNTPLKPAAMTHGKIVDWDVVEEQLYEFGILNDNKV